MVRGFDELRKLRPGGSRVGFPLEVVVGLDQQASFLFRAIYRNLEENLVSPANVLLRTLLWDSLALQYMALEDAEQRALQWLRSAIRGEIGFLHGMSGAAKNEAGTRR